MEGRGTVFKRDNRAEPSSRTGWGYIKGVGKVILGWVLQ